MNKQRLFRELIKYEYNEMIEIVHNESGEVATGEMHDLMYQFVVDMENLFSDMFNKQTYELRKLNNDELSEIMEELESNFRYGF